ncbi:MAG TPA: BTAD domain-containing putative transcriptional regulator [Usitatibacter sp.]|nr:BTAD domain-containing putative transcriptional regulator [Usitatibacter sp.]
MTLRIYLTGRVAVEGPGGVLGEDAFPGRQGVVLFARLVLERRQASSREALARTLWPEDLPRAWESALQALASKLRGALESAGVDKSALASALGCYQLTLPGDAWVDAEAAGEAIHEAEGCLRASDMRGCWSAAQVAYHVARRPFLGGERLPWVEAQRERLAAIHARACECLAEAYLWNAEPQVAMDVARELVEIQPYRETGYQLLMRAHAAAGNRAEALLVYERCRELISAELGVAPSAQTQAVHRDVLNTR